jgi:hypothetical protein
MTGVAKSRCAGLGMTGVVASIALASLFGACGRAPEASRLQGDAAHDAVTAKLRDGFSAGTAPAIDQANLTSGGGWSCSYHADTDDVVFRGFDDVDYHSTYSRAGMLLKEHADDVLVGIISLDGWDADYVATDAGLRSGGGESTRVIRNAADGTLLIEWLYQADPHDTRGDVGIADPKLRATGYAVCVGDDG